MSCTLLALTSSLSVGQTGTGSQRLLALRNAAAKGDIPGAQAALSSGANINEPSGVDKLTPLFVAADHGNGKMVAFLIGKGANVNLAMPGGGDTALTQAAANGHTDVVKLLMAKGATVDQSHKLGMTPLMNAAWKGHVDCVRILLRAHANPNLKDSRGRTAAQWAQGQEDLYLRMSVKRPTAESRREAAITAKRYNQIVDLLAKH